MRAPNGILVELQLLFFYPPPARSLTVSTMTEAQLWHHRRSNRATQPRRGFAKNGSEKKRVNAEGVKNMITHARLFHPAIIASASR